MLVFQWCRCLYPPRYFGIWLLLLLLGCCHFRSMSCVLFLAFRAPRSCQRIWGIKSWKMLAHIFAEKMAVGFGLANLRCTSNVTVWFDGFWFIHPSNPQKCLARCERRRSHDTPVDADTSTDNFTWTSSPLLSLCKPQNPKNIGHRTSWNFQQIASHGSVMGIKFVLTKETYKRTSDLLPQLVIFAPPPDWPSKRRWRLVRAICQLEMISSWTLEINLQNYWVLLGIHLIHPKYTSKYWIYGIWTLYPESLYSNKMESPIFFQYPPGNFNISRNEREVSNEFPVTFFFRRYVTLEATRLPFLP